MKRVPDYCNLPIISIKVCLTGPLSSWIYYMRELRQHQKDPVKANNKGKLNCEQINKDNLILLNLLTHLTQNITFTNLANEIIWTEFLYKHCVYILCHGYICCTSNFRRIQLPSPTLIYTLTFCQFHVLPFKFIFLHTVNFAHFILCFP